MIRALLVVAALAADPAVAQCRQALALGLDVSGSVDAREYRLQLGGLAGALRHPDVRAALLAMPQAPVRLAVFEWSGPAYQRLLLDWQTVTEARELDALAARLEATARQPAPPGTALGTAMEFGAALLETQGECWKRTLDLSGDGQRNVGPHPRDVQRRLAARPITVNGLVIGADPAHGTDRRQAGIARLSAYYRAWVLTGPDAFVETAIGFEDYEDAMIRKLKRELQGLAVSQRMSPVRPGRP